MKRLLIIKFGAGGDVVRTTPLLHLFPRWEIDWLTAPENTQLVPPNKVSRVLTENGKTFSNGVYDLVINLEDDEELLRRILPNVTYRTIFGSYTNGSGTVGYISDSAGWFDLGLASIHGPKKADALKLINRKTYQELIFQGLGHQFRGEPYLLPDSLPPSNLHGDVAIATESRMKKALAVAALGLLVVGGPAFASAELAKQKNCLACRATDKKLVGPSYKDVAAKYKSDKNAPATLAKKIREGGVGNWGQVPMPANPQVNEQEAASLAKWVLSQ